MELKLLLKHIQKRIWFILIFTLIGTVVSAIVVNSLPPSYSASVTLYVDKSIERSESGDYTFDGYYAQQAAEGYADTVVGLVESPDTIAIALRRQDIEVEGNIEEYIKSLEVEKVAPQIILVTVTRLDRSDAVNVVSELVTVVGEKIVKLNQEEGPQYSIDRVEDMPLVKINTLPEIMVIVASGLVTILVGMFGVLFELYLREDD